MISNFGKKRNSEYFDQQLFFKALGIIFLIIISVLLVADFKMYKKRKELNKEIIAYQKKIADIEKNSQTLKEEIENANNVDYLEKLGYEQLDQTRPGETEFMFINSHEYQEVSQIEEDSLRKNKILGWFEQGWRWLKSKF
jgi:cell division protein FtsB